MSDFPSSLSSKLKSRVDENSLRSLKSAGNLIDFSSNDYLGFARSQEIFNHASEILHQNGFRENGSTGSRLISGNHPLYDFAENQIAKFHHSESALIFNSGYDANIGFFSSVPQRSDIVLYDEYCHASIRDGIKLSHAKSFKFKHNDLNSLKHLLEKYKETELYVVTESVFSMDGDSPDFLKLAKLAEKYNARLIIDEAHAVGIFGGGRGLIHAYGITDKVFARIITFGKALGCHGAAILGSADLKSYLINFARSFIYTTGLPPHSVATIIAAYQQLSASEKVQKDLNLNITRFAVEAERQKVKLFNSGLSPIQTILVPGNDRVRSASEQLIASGFDIRPIMSPTVPKGMERLRICIHSFNSKDEINSLVSALSRVLSA